MMLFLPVFECLVSKLSVRSRLSGYSEDDLAIAVRAAKEILTEGKCSLILEVEAMGDGWFDVRKNVGAFIAAHILNHSKLTVQEKEQ